MAFGAPVDFNYFLQRKYALLQQQADAGTSNAASAAIQANAQAGALGAEARLNNTRADLAPGESAADIGVKRAQTDLLGQQAKYYGPEAEARIGQTNAETGYLGAQTDFLGTQNKVLRRNSLTGIFGGDAGTPQPGTGGIFSGSGYTGYRLPVTGPVVDSTPLPTERKPGESHTAWVARLRSMGY